MSAKELPTFTVDVGADRFPVHLELTIPFRREAKKLFSKEELERLVEHVAQFRELGTVIPDTGGLRKLRWAMGTRGKSHGARVIYYFGGDHMPLYLLSVYTKAQRENLSPAARKAAKKFVMELKNRFAPDLRRKQLRVIEGDAS